MIADEAHDQSNPVSPKPGGNPLRLVDTPRAADGGKLRVFISYSRDDLDFTDQLDAALDACGFDCVIDRHDIPGGEDWKRRLGNLISEADTVVFVLSPASAHSAMCAWEVEEAARLGKRILPVNCRPLGDSHLPQRLRDLNHIFFHPEPKVPGSGFGTGLASLTAALNTDFDWLREHTRYLQRATEWNAGGRPTNRLLSGSDIAEAKAWAARRPKSAPEPTALHLDFIRASEDEAAARSDAQRKQLAEIAAAQVEREKALHQAEEALKQAADAQRKRARNRNLALLIMTFSAVLAGWLWQGAEQQRKIAEDQTALAEDQRAKAEVAGSKAIVARRETEIALADSYFHQAVTHLEGEKPFAALAYATRAVALNPGNDAARALMLDLLLWRPWPRLLVGAESEVTSVAVSTNGGILMVASGGKASVYEVDSGAMQGWPLAHQSPISAVALTADGKLAATGDMAGQIRLWTLGSDIKQGNTLTLVGRINSLAFSRDGRRLVAAASNGAQVWDANTGAPLGPTLRSGSGSVGSAEFGGDDTRIVTVNADSIQGRVQVWDYQRGVPVGKPVEAGGQFAYACLDETGKLVMTGAYGAPSFARVWEVETGKPITPQLTHKDFPIRGRFLEDGKKLLTISRDGSARVWALPEGGNQPAAEFTHEGTLLSAAISPDGSGVATVASDRSVLVWDRRTAVRKPLTIPSDEPVTNGALSANGEFAVAFSGAKVSIAQSSTGILRRIGFGANANDVAISNDGSQLAFASRSGEQILVLDTSGSRPPIRTKSRQTSSDLGSDLPGFKIYYDDAKGFLVYVYGRYADILQIRDGRFVGAQLRHDDIIRTVNFSRDGERMVTSSRDGTVRVWNTRTGDQALPPLAHREATVAAGFNATAERVVSASRNALIWSWDLASQRVPPPISLHGAGLIGVASFSADGTRVATTDYQTVKVWDTRTGLPLSTLRNGVPGVTKLRLSDDGLRLLTVGSEVSVWDLPMVAKDDAMILSRWGEAVAGLRVVDSEGLRAIENPKALMTALHEEAIAAAQGSEAWAMVRWFFADPAKRTIAPLSRAPR